MADWSSIARRIRVPLGFALAVVYVWMARPTWTSLVNGVLIAVPGILLRALASGHVKKNEELTTSGPYAYTRNPLYLGSLIIALGFAIAARNLWILFFMAVMFFAIYLPVIRSEEEFLRRTFAEFAAYAKNVPRLFPRLTPFGNAPATFSSELYWQHREYNAVFGSVALLVALLAKLFWAS